MRIFDLLSAGLLSKQVDDETILYFDQNGDVCLIEHQNRVTYACLSDGRYLIETELLVGRTITCPTSKKLRNFFVIPNIDKRDDITVLNEGLTEYSFPVSEMPRCLYKVVSFGIAENPIWAGANISRSIINVAVENPVNKIYQISMKLGDGVKACDGNPHGTIQNAYKLTSLCTKIGNLIKITI